MLKYFSIMLIVTQVHAEVVSLKDFVRNNTVTIHKAQRTIFEKNSTIPSEDKDQIQKINHFFKLLEQEHPELAPFVMLEDQILMSKINQNIEKISPTITQFRAFTLFKMEKMNLIFEEITKYLKDNNEKTQKDSFRIEME